MNDRLPPKPANFAATYIDAAPDYFEHRSLRKHAGVWSIWALGVGAGRSGHFSGWNLGLGAGGWGGMLIAAGIMALMFLERFRV